LPRQPKSTPKPHVRISSTGLKRLGGRIFEEFLAELRFPQGLRAYDEMRKNSGVVGGFLRAIEASFRSVRWFTVPADDSPRATAHAAFAESCRRDMRLSWASYVSDSITFLPFGFSAMEMVFKRREGRQGKPPSMFSDGMIGFDEIPLIGHDSIIDWAWDEQDVNRLSGIWQIAPPTYQRVMIPREKFMLFRTKAEKDNPEGESILRQAYYDYYSMLRLEAVESISLERTGAGIPVVTLPKGATTKADVTSGSDEEAAEELVRSVRVDEQGGVIEPEGWKFRLERPNGRVDPQLFDLAIKRHRSSMLMSVLAVFLELGTARVGSFALASQGQNFFEAAFEGYVMSFEETYNEEALPLLFALNGVTDLLPKLTHVTVAGADISAIVEAVQRLTQEGYLDSTDPMIQNYLKDLIRLPRGDTAKELEDITRPNQPSSNGASPGGIKRDEDEDEEDDNGIAEDELVR